MSVLFTSDLHLGDNFVAQLRGFKSTQEHDDAVIESIVKVATKRSHLWILGDLGGDLDSVKRLKDIQCQKKIMVAGNHDDFATEEYLDIFDVVRGAVSYKNMWITHFPIHPTEFYYKLGNVHGHVHKPQKGTINDIPALGYPYLNVNWEYWGKPLQLENIKNEFILYKDGK